MPLLCNTGATEMGKSVSCCVAFGKAIENLGGRRDDVLVDLPLHAARARLQEPMQVAEGGVDGSVVVAESRRGADPQRRGRVPIPIAMRTPIRTASHQRRYTPVRA